MSDNRSSGVLSQFLCFAAVGAVGTLAHYAVLIALVQGQFSGPVTASAAGFGVGAMVNYVLNYHFTFRSSHRHGEAWPKFMLVALIGLALNTGVMSLLIDEAGVHYLISQIIATGVTLFWNFVANRHWTFGGQTT